MAPMMTPLSVQFTLEQQAWLDQLTRGGLLSRSSVIRLIVAEAMERDQLASKPRKRQGLDGQR
jgi:Arc/MetJ-type ribon-helix-helix transcriptional regulator